MSVTAFEAHCPDHIETGRWHQAVEDEKRFLSQWGGQAEALGWTARAVTHHKSTSEH